MVKADRRDRNPTVPTDDLIPFSDALSDVMSGVIWGTEGTGKTLFLLKGAPTPIILLNLDRPLTSAIERAVGSEDSTRAEFIHVKNMRENLDDLDQLRSLQIKEGIESVIRRNKAYLRGGTLVIDGGSTFRDVIKLADSRIGARIEAGQRFNPKDKAQVNAYLNTFVSNVVDAGINLFFTAHAAFKWEMRAGEEGKQSLMKTNRLYVKLDDVLLEQTSVSVLMMKRCVCSQGYINEDGYCSRATAKNQGEHTGRTFVARIVTNKFNPQVEGEEYEDFDFRLLRTLSFTSGRSGRNGQGKGEVSKAKAASPSRPTARPAARPSARPRIGTNSHDGEASEGPIIED